MLYIEKKKIFYFDKKLLYVDKKIIYTDNKNTPRWEQNYYTLTKKMLYVDKQNSTCCQKKVNVHKETKYKLCASQRTRITTGRIYWLVLLIV